MHDDACPSFQGAVELVGRRWTGAILFAASQGARRFGEYRSVIPSTPAQIRYALAPDGQALIDALQPLAQWSAHRLRRAGEKQPGMGVYRLKWVISTQNLRK